MTVRILAVCIFGLVLVTSCDSGGGDCPDPSTNIVNGCPSYVCEGQAAGAESDTYQTFGEDFFEGYCTRCHAQARDLVSDCTSEPERCRNNAPLGYDWDDPEAIRAHLAEIRLLGGVLNEMPVTAPFPSCEERRRLVQWIDEGAPGLP